MFRLQETCWWARDTFLSWGSGQHLFFRRINFGIWVDQKTHNRPNFWSGFGSSAPIGLQATPTLKPGALNTVNIFFIPTRLKYRVSSESPCSPEWPSDLKSDKIMIFSKWRFCSAVNFLPSLYLKNDYLLKFSECAGCHRVIPKKHKKIDNILGSFVLTVC